MNPQQKGPRVSDLNRTGVSIEPTIHNLTMVRNRLNAIADHFEKLDTVVFRYGITTIWEHMLSKAAREFEDTRHPKRISYLPRKCEIQQEPASP